MAGISLQAMIQNDKKLRGSIAAVPKNSAKAIDATVRDFKSRAPGWVKKVVREHYNIPANQINGKSKDGGRSAGRISVAGTNVATARLIYKGRVLTPTHFKMKPTRRKKRPYVVSAEIKKGQRKDMPGEPGRPIFLGGTGGAGKQIPFQREGKDRLPIVAIKTVSVPQMVSNEKVSDDIQKTLRDKVLRVLLAVLSCCGAGEPRFRAVL